MKQSINLASGLWNFLFEVSKAGLKRSRICYPKTCLFSIRIILSWLFLRNSRQGFPGGAVVENLPANAGDTGSSPGLGRSHMPPSNWAREPQLLSLRVWSLCSATRGSAIVRGPRTAMKSGPRLPQLEKALAQKRRPNTAIKKKKKQQTEEKLWELSRRYPFVRDIYIYKRNLHVWECLPLCIKKRRMILNL